MALGSTQPLIEMSTKNHPGGKRWRASKADDLTLVLSSSNLGHALPLLNFMREISGSNLGALDTQYPELFS
jgi:hypothetical protein